MEKNITNEKMKRFIVEHANLLNKETKLKILNLIVMEVGQSVIMETVTKEIDINLDYLEKKNLKVLIHIYNIIKRRIDILNQPAKYNEYS